ncbi:hypothetical protein L195_g053277, partial [Trifolium pratense]
ALLAPNAQASSTIVTLIELTNGRIHYSLHGIRPLMRHYSRLTQKHLPPLLHSLSSQIAEYMDIANPKLTILSSQRKHALVSPPSWCMLMT